MDTKKKITILLIAIIAIFLVWQVIGMFKGESSTATATPPTNGKAQVSGANAPNSGAIIPRQQALSTEAATSKEQQMALAQLQQDTQAKMISGISQLQLLKLQKDIADANKDIMAAKLAAVNSAKEIVDKLSKPVVQENRAAYGENLGGPTQMAPSGVTNAAMAGVQMPAGSNVEQQTNFIVISLTELMSKWSAVLGSQGKLYNVSVGDTLMDGSSVKSIDRSGVLLEKNGVTRKLSLVPIV